MNSRQTFCVHNTYRAHFYFPIIPSPLAQALRAIERESAAAAKRVADAELVRQAEEERKVAAAKVRNLNILTLTMPHRALPHDTSPSGC